MTRTSEQYTANEQEVSSAVADKPGRVAEEQQQFVENMALGVLVFDNRQRLLYANRSAVDLLGDLAPVLDDSETSPHLSLEQVFPEGVFPGWVDLLSAPDGLYSPGQSAHMIARRGSSEHIFGVTVAHVPGNDETEPVLIVTLDDITARKHNDQRLSEIEKSSDKGVMAAHIAHDLNNFLGLVLGGVEIAQMAMAKGNIEKADRSLEKIKNNVGRLEEFTRSLERLTFSETNDREDDFNRVVAGVLSYVAVQTSFKNLVVQTEFDFSIPRFVLDAAQMEQLLLNVLNNAADAVTESERSDGRIVARTWLENDCACLSITDNGVGIKPEIRERLFRSHLTTKADHYGYGLVGCCGIINHHQAQFEIESEPEKGATFTFRFPLHREPTTDDSADL